MLKSWALLVEMGRVENHGVLSLCVETVRWAGISQGLLGVYDRSVSHQFIRAVVRIDIGGEVTAKLNF